MTATRGRNGILVFLAPWRRRVLIVADQGITTKVAPAPWTGAVATITTAFASGKFTDGLVVAFDELGRSLAPHFPPVSRSNELSDRIDR